MNYLPNVISVIRILLSTCLLVVDSFGLPFWCIYAACGISDMADGFLARKFQVTSKGGAVLDSVGDTVFAVIMAAIVLIHALIPMWSVHWIVVIMVIKLTTILIGYIKFRAFAAVHSYANKTVGLFLFIGLPVYFTWNKGIIVGILLAGAMLAGMEELLIILTSKKLNRNIKSIFSSKR